MKVLLLIILIGYIIYGLYKSFKRSIANTLEKEILISKFSRLIEKNPKNPRAYFLRGVTYHLLRHYLLALDDYKKALELNPNNKSFDYIYNEKSDFKTFNNSDINFNLNSIKRKTGNENEQLISKFSREIESCPTNPRAYYLRGFYYAKLHHYKLSIDDLTIALDLNPTNESFEFPNSQATFNNVNILQVRSQVKKQNKDKTGAIEDLKLSKQLIEKHS